MCSLALYIKHRHVPELEPRMFAEACMKHSLAHKGAYEAADMANFYIWTYPTELGAQVLQELLHQPKEQLKLVECCLAKGLPRHGKTAEF